MAPKHSLLTAGDLSQKDIRNIRSTSDNQDKPSNAEAAKATQTNNGPCEAPGNQTAIALWEGPPNAGNG